MDNSIGQLRNDWLQSRSMSVGRAYCGAVAPSHEAIERKRFCALWAELDAYDQFPAGMIWLAPEESLQLVTDAAQYFLPVWTSSRFSVKSSLHQRVEALASPSKPSAHWLLETESDLLDVATNLFSEEQHAAGLSSMDNLLCELAYAFHGVALSAKELFVDHDIEKFASGLPVPAEMLRILEPTRVPTEHRILNRMQRLIVGGSGRMLSETGS